MIVKPQSLCSDMPYRRLRQQFTEPAMYVDVMVRLGTKKKSCVDMLSCAVASDDRSERVTTAAGENSIRTSTAPAVAVRSVYLKAQNSTTKPSVKMLIGFRGVDCTHPALWTIERKAGLPLVATGPLLAGL